MRVKRTRAKEPPLPDELFVQPQLLEQLANSQDRGLIYYGESVYPPWKRQRKSAKDERKFRSQSSKLSVQASHVKPQVVKVPKRPFSPDEDKIIIAERRRGTTWDLISRMLSGRTAAKVKKHYHQNLKHRAIDRAKGLAGRSSKIHHLDPHTGGVIPLTSEDREKKLYNKIVIVPGKMDKKQRPQLFFVLNYNELVAKCHLVPLMEYGVFRSDSPREGKTKWKLVPEGQGEELEGVPASDCTIVRSEATNKVSDADREAWQIFDPRYE